MVKKYKPYKVDKGKEIEVIRTEDDKIFAGEWCMNRMSERDDMLSFGTYSDSIRGKNQLASLTVESISDNNLVTGLPDFGKQSLLRNIKLQLIQQNRGLIDVSTKSNEIDKFVSRIPEDRKDDIIIVDPVEYNIGFNILHNPLEKTHTKYNETSENIAINVKNQIRSKSSNWGSKIDYISEQLLLHIINSDDKHTIIDVIELLQDEDKLKKFLHNLENQKIPGSFDNVDSTLDPILRRLNGWVENRIMRTTVANTESNFSLYDLVLEDKIIIIDLSKVEKKSICDVITHHITNTANILPERDITHIFFDRHSFTHNEIETIEEIPCGVFLSIDRLDNYNDDERKILRKFENKIAFGTGKDNREASLVAQMFNVGANEVMELNNLECLTHIMTEDGYKSDVPVKIRVFRDRIPESELKTQYFKSKSEEKFVVQDPT